MESSSSVRRRGTPTACQKLHHAPDELVQERDQHRSAPAQPAAERGRIRHRSPAEEAADAAAGEELQIVHPAAPVEEQRHPELDHEARSVAAGLTGRLGVEPAADPERIPGAAKKQKSGPIRQFSGAVAQPQRGSRVLHMRARGDNVVAHRLGASGCRVTSWQKSPQRKASGGVLHPQIKPPAQDPG